MSRKLKDVLRGVLTPTELQCLVQSYDVVGDIAIIIIPPELIEKEHFIAAAILSLHKNIKVVAKRDGIYGGEFRTLPLRIIGGEQRKETVHTEDGVRLMLNPETVYFSVRSGTERKRIASLVQAKEEVLVLFSGIGPYPLIIGRANPSCRVVGIEKNPEAHRYALKNLGSNRRITNVRLYQGDVDSVLPALDRKFDRIVMPLPTSAEVFLSVALAALRRQGWLHFYDLQQEGRFEDTVAKIEAACRRDVLQLLSAEIAVCGHCGPRTYRICVDAQIGRISDPPHLKEGQENFKDNQKDNIPLDPQ